MSDLKQPPSPDTAADAQVVLRHVTTSEILLEHFDQPAIVLARCVNRILGSETLLKDLVREADAEWGRTLGDRPYFEREGQPPHPEDPYTLASVRHALTQLVQSARRSECPARERTAETSPAHRGARAAGQGPLALTCNRTAAGNE
jgi:hypothetical protein